MGKSLIQPGETHTYTAAGTFTKDTGLVIGGLFGIHANSGVAGDLATLELTGSRWLAADAAYDPSEGDLVFFDNSAKTCKASASGYFQIGTCVRTKANGKIGVRLDGIGVTTKSGSLVM